MTIGEGKEPAALILAAGRGTRMKSDMAKVLHLLAGRPLLAYVVDAARGIGAGRIVAVVGHQAEEVREAFRDDGLVFVEQRPQLGTGHAVQVARKAFADFVGPVLILCGDVPLLKVETLRQFLAFHRDREAVLTLFTARLDNPHGYGRVVMDENNALLRIVEERDATAEEKKIREINTGIYCVESPFLFEAVSGIGRDNAQGEYYLTDIIAVGRERGIRMVSYLARDPAEVMGINTPDDLAGAEKVLLARATG
ncbi:MAG: NTP transferase domain-containing protein [Smithellaceae bacterium]|nr:NTP transferase domain-containing protein [Smithellaceae bacterium]